MTFSYKIEAKYFTFWILSLFCGSLSVFSFYQLFNLIFYDGKQVPHKSRKSRQKSKCIDHPQKDRRPAGIINTSNDCFKNALIQALASLYQLETYVHSVADINDNSFMYVKALSKTCQGRLNSLCNIIV